MGLVIGMDEAGYGPNFGPLVVTVTVWEVRGAPEKADFWSRLAAMCCSDPQRDDERLHVADSKIVYSPARGLAALERSVLAACRMAGLDCSSFRSLWDSLRAPSEDDDVEPWFDGEDVLLPCRTEAEPLDGLASRWHACCRKHGMRLLAIRSDLVLTRRFNRSTEHYGGKGAALSKISLKLLRSVWDPDTDGRTLIIADKHGGRNRYDVLLHEVLEDLSEPGIGPPLVQRLQESRDLSRYRVGKTELRFQTRAESHFPVALASMVSKYLRELAMLLFNRFWTRHIPDLRPTAGYPTDAYRFRKHIAAAQQRLGIPDEILWRAR